MYNDTDVGRRGSHYFGTSTNPMFSRYVVAVENKLRYGSFTNGCRFASQRALVDYNGVVGLQ